MSSLQSGLLVVISLAVGMPPGRGQTPLPARKAPADLFAVFRGAGDPPKEKKKERELTPKELQALWADLAGDDAAKAYQAILAIVASPKNSVPFLGKHLKPAAPVDPMTLARLIGDLGSDHLKTRDRAIRELEKLGPLARQALEKVLAGEPPKSLRQRVEDLLDMLETRRLTPDELRAARALEALELLDSGEARKLLEQLARGAPGALLTEDAKGALKRLNKKMPPP
jgi:hypothetical protein